MIFEDTITKNLNERNNGEKNINVLTEDKIRASLKSIKMLISFTRVKHALISDTLSKVLTFTCPLKRNFFVACLQQLQTLCQVRNHRIPKLGPVFRT